MTRLKAPGIHPREPLRTCSQHSLFFCRALLWLRGVNCADIRDINSSTTQYAAFKYLVLGSVCIKILDTQTFHYDCDWILVFSRFGNLICVHRKWWYLLKQSAELAEVLCLLPASRWFLAWLTLRSWRRKQHVPPKRQLTSNSPHGVISQIDRSLHNHRCENLKFHIE
jgi:hypothetical protein